MNTKITDKNGKSPIGWIFYDAECALCVQGVKRWNNLFARRGFCWVPLQTPGSAKRLGTSESSMREEMKLLLASGQVLGGVDAWALLFRSVWWLWLMGVLLDFPIVHWFGARCYRSIAKNRHCLSGRCNLREHRTTHHRHAAFFQIP